MSYLCCDRGLHYHHFLLLDAREGFEPSTCRLWVCRSAKLSYRALWRVRGLSISCLQLNLLADQVGLEPTTFCLQSNCSPIELSARGLPKCLEFEFTTLEQQNYFTINQTKMQEEIYFRSGQCQVPGTNSFPVPAAAYGTC